MGQLFTMGNRRRAPVAPHFARGSRRPARCLGLILLIPALFAAVPASAQVNVPEDKWNRGYHGFAELCRQMGLRTVKEMEWRATPPSQSVLVAFGAFADYPRDVETYVRRGGAVLIATDRGQRGGRKAPGVMLWNGPVESADQSAALQGFRDCPIVSKLEDHPLTRNVLGIATNRPGWLHHDPGDGMAGEPWTVLARLPMLRMEDPFGQMHEITGPKFLAALETSSGGRAVVMADQSIFANQMLLFEDNLAFMGNVVSWLGEGRATVLILDDRSIVPPSPGDVHVEVPPPTPEEVRDALRQLPPDVLVPFANAVIASLEDAGIPNELIAFFVQRISNLNYRRLLFFVATFCLVVAVFRHLIGESVAEKATADDSNGPAAPDRRRRARFERQQAARELLERFRSDVAEISAVPWPVFASRLRIRDQRWRTWLLRRRLRHASGRLEPKRDRYWTRRRLRSLNARINQWRRLRAAGELEYA
jgi:hypothetical protein